MASFSLHKKKRRMSTTMRPLMYGPAGAGAPQDPRTLEVGQNYLVESLDSRITFHGTFIRNEGSMVYFYSGPISFSVHQMSANFWKTL